MTFAKGLQLLTCLVVVTSPASAQETKPHAIDAALAACEKKQGASTRGEAECLSTAFESWEKDIATNYEALKKLVSANELAPLEAGQKSWSDYRDQEFDFINQLFKNKRGTMYVPIRINYRIEVLKARALELETYLHRIRRLQGSEN